jgi:hypothetical protein
MGGKAGEMMKTEADLQNRLMAELKAWVVRQCHNPYTAYYLYYLETTPEHDGGILICENPPANGDYQLASPDRISPGGTVNQNFNKYRQICRSLPVLS